MASGDSAARGEAGGSVAALRVVMVSYPITEEAGGPGVAATGFAAGLARLGAEVALLALDSRRGRWLVTEDGARSAGHAFRRVGGRWLPGRVQALLAAMRELGAASPRPTVQWVNGIWGPQSLAAAMACGRYGWPYVLRPAGSLGAAALGYKRLKKRLYYRLVESRIARAAAAIHCMSEKEVSELPPELRARAFVVPSGVDLPSPSPARRDPRLLGVLARLHPIKNHPLVLDAMETLLGNGHDLELELAGSASDAGYAEKLRARVRSSPRLAARVRFLGHVARERLPDVVGRWRAALLVSEQENFGHAVVTAAALGVPTVASPGVGLAPGLAAAGAGVVVHPRSAAEGVEALLARDVEQVARACRAFAARYTWQACAQELLGHLGPVARGVVSARR